MKGEHHYHLTVRWTGNRSTGTSGYRAYERSHIISIEGKADIAGSSDPTFHGDKALHNPEEMLLSAIAACHMMSYLHVCVAAGVVVTAYTDRATGTMKTLTDGSGHFTGVTLHPEVTVADQSMETLAHQLHTKARQLCFIANSVNFPVHHEPVCVTDPND